MPPATRRVPRKRKATKTQKAARKSPTESATSVAEGTIRRGNDGSNWVSVKAATGVQRWVPVASATLHGLRRLTVDDVASAFRAGKPLTFFERGGGEPMWPASVRGLGRTLFHPNGDLLVGKKRYAGWLRTRTPGIRDHTMCLLDGLIVFNPGTKDHMEVAGGVQIDSLNKKLVSSNIMNVEAFVI